MLNETDLFKLAKEASSRPDLPFGGYGLCPKCGVDTAPGTSRERRIDGNTTCGACHEQTKSALWKQATAIPYQEEEERAKTPGKGFIQAAKGVGNKVTQVGAMLVGGAQALGKATPPLKMNPRY